MSKRTQYGVAALLLMASVATAAPYSKYGRSCRDINCLSNEICVMAQDPCDRYSTTQCGNYPTCKRTSEAGQQTCATLICPSGQYCKTNNGNPTCVNTVPELEFDTAGVSSINGHQTNANGGNRPDLSSSNTNQNPYSNANAPPANQAPNHAVHSETNLGYPAYANPGSSVNTGNGGYPAYPANPGTNSGSSGGYPGYPSNTGTNGGYPGYPPNPGYGGGNIPAYPYGNRQPLPGQNIPYYNPGYPAQNNYPNYPKNNYNSVYHKRNSGVNAAPTVSLVFLSLALVSRFFS